MVIIRDFKKGETLRFSIDYEDQDITGFVFDLVFRSDLTALTNDLEFQSTSGDHADDDPTSGYKVIEVPTTETDKLTVGKTYYQLMATDGLIEDIIAPIGCSVTLNVCQNLKV